ncbi:dihydroneopterin aldolase, partial [Actinomyces succiniciruminis]
MSTNHANADRIVLTGLSARGYHGLLPFERTEGQLFTADVTVFLGERGTAVAAVTDSLDDAVNYVDIAREVVGVIEGEPVGLLETLAERISDAVLALP